MANELLDKGIKAAKSKDMPFAILYQGKNGSIGIATDENTAKKHCTEGNKNPKVPGSPMTGIVKWDKSRPNTNSKPSMPAHQWKRR